MNESADNMTVKTERQGAAILKMIFVFILGMTGFFGYVQFAVHDVPSGAAVCWFIQTWSIFWLMKPRVTR